MMKLKVQCIKVANYDFTDKKGIHVLTSKLLISLGQYGSVTTCTNLVQDKQLLEEFTADIEVDNKNRLKVVKVY